MSAARRSGRHYLARLEALRRTHGNVFRTGRGKLYIADAVLAKQILGNNSGQFREHSDFFRIRSGTLGPRSAQVAIGRAARRLLQEHAHTAAQTLPGLVARHLRPTSVWPDAGNRLLLAYAHQALVGPQPSAALRETVEAIVERGVLAGSRDRYSWLSRARFRRRAMRVIAAELAQRRVAPGNQPASLLDVLAQEATVDTSDHDLAEVYRSCVFAVCGSIGFLLGWSLYLLGTTSTTEPVRPDRVVREALRLWPVAWLFSRRPDRTFDLGGVTVTPADDVLVCGYLVHRDPNRWTEPDRFDPSRWESAKGQEAFLPFGWGPHSCTGAGVSMHLVETLIELITSTYRLDVTVTDPRPHIAAALAPPSFLLRLGNLSQPRGGDDHGEALLRGQAGAEHLRR